MESKTAGILSIVSGAVGLLLLPSIFGPLAIFFGVKARKNVPRTCGTIGIACGMIALSFWVAFPLVSQAFDIPIPVRIQASGSMAHEADFDDWWASQEKTYQTYGITREQFKAFPFPDGIGYGDIIIITRTGYAEVDVGDIILFESGKDVIIHRVVKRSHEGGIYSVGTKGDHNRGSLLFEKEILEDRILGKVQARIPKAGLFNIWMRNVMA